MSNTITNPSVELQLVQSGWKMFHECTYCNGQHARHYKKKEIHGVEAKVVQAKPEKTFVITKWSKKLNEGTLDQLMEAVAEL